MSIEAEEGVSVEVSVSPRGVEKASNPTGQISELWDARDDQKARFWT